MRTPLTSYRSGPLNGALTAPGDKSISHRAVMLGGIAEGKTTVQGLLEGDDVMCTIAALRELGSSVTKELDVWTIEGKGLAALKAPRAILDMGNSGTAARLLIGLLAGRPFSSSFTGDASLCKRPMGRVISPLSDMGASFNSPNGKLPLTVVGSQEPRPINYLLPVASAQVKSAILFAGLSADGLTSVSEKAPTRDHTENMLRYFGADVVVSKLNDVETITLKGRPKLIGKNIIVPSDPSSAAFPLVAAILHTGSNVTLRQVGLNPRRTGLITTLREMGADIRLANAQVIAGEPLADIQIKGSPLQGIDVPADRAPSMIDEYPVLAIAAACAHGTTRMKGLAELRVKESDRLTLMAEGLHACGVDVAIEGDDLIVYGGGKAPRGGATIETAMDHRIAMSFLILGSVSTNAVSIDDGGFISTSFPNFTTRMNELGMAIK